MEIKYIFLGEELNAIMKGELDEYTASYVRLSLDTLLKDMDCINSPKLVLDFSGVTFMDSTG
ncbi:MAG: STAS domain-containing protein, partial [Clostridia bacterium]|nr:STAS domain-containing protein [Clostridia bacterium]